MHYDVIIVGAGAAGLMCAIEAGKRGRNILLLDHAQSIGEKIRISGGGRCNFTNIHTSPANYLSQNPRFCISALSRYTQHDFIKLIEKYSIAYHEKTLGQLFCDGSSKQIINMLLDQCKLVNVTPQANTKVLQIDKKDSTFSVEISGEETITSDAVVIATGGPSIPKIGATSWGYDIAKHYDMHIVEPIAALVPFTIESKSLEEMRLLSGISLDVVVTCNKKSFHEGMLFTHRGLSGPAILQISSYWKEGDEITINLLPGHDLFSTLKEERNSHPKQDISTILSRIVPKKLALYLCKAKGYKGTLADLSNKQLQEVSDHIQQWKVVPSGTEGFRTAEVTLGGVDTNELSSKTFETKKVPGLYFIGEVVDVTGHLGGFNFQWAWSSGYAAGQYV